MRSYDHISVRIGRRRRVACWFTADRFGGISVFCALDAAGSATLEGLLRRFESYRLVHLPRVRILVAAGFELLPSFRRPHYTLRISGVATPDLARLLDALGPPEVNPYHGGTRPRRS